MTDVGLSVRFSCIFKSIIFFDKLCQRDIMTKCFFLRTMQAVHYCSFLPLSCSLLLLFIVSILACKALRRASLSTSVIQINLTWLSFLSVKCHDFLLSAKDTFKIRTIKKTVLTEKDVFNTRCKAVYSLERIPIH